MRKKKKHGHNKPHDKLNHLVERFMGENPNYVYNPKQVARKLRLSGKKQIDKVLFALLDLEDKDIVVQIEPQVFKYKTKLEDVIIGRVDYVNYRFAFVVPEDGESDIKISRDNLMCAMDGDVVRVGVYPHSRGKNREGEVVDIVKRRHEELIGRVEMSDRFAFVVPDNRKIHDDIFIPFNGLNDAQNGQKVLVKITEFASERKSAEGKILEVLGQPGDHSTEMHSIMHEFGLKDSFPKKVIKEANALDESISKEEVAKRRDMREITTFTIDPEDAKDFDDAISFQKLENGNYEIGVHIADVSHYVKPGTALDAEAFDRATSVYLVDRVVPMLPEKLSNELCSLRPHEEKLSFSAIFELNEKGGVEGQWLGRTVIYSDRRFTYEEAQEIIEGAEGDFQEEIRTLNSIAKNIRDKRFKNGAINFETPEVRIKLDENNVPIGVVPKIRVDAHKLVEEYMLLANRQVASYVDGLKNKLGKQTTMVYRVHEEPNPEKVLTFSAFAKRFGHDVNTDKLQSSLNSLVVDIEGKPEEHILQNLAIRAMAKARYTCANLGHYGLGFSHYTHFTSPIRRYPDVMVHRLLQHYLDGGKPMPEDEIEEKCKHSSEQEKNAADAERTSIKYKQVEFMQKFIGEEFDGVVAGVKDWGFFVEIPETASEGLVKTSSLTDDYYVYDEDRLELVGKRNKHAICFGDKVRVKVINTNLMDRTIDLEYIRD